MSLGTPSLILLADPSPTEREMYAEYLSWCGFRVVQCEGGPEAFEKALTVCPDLVCASFVMRRGTGAELCAALHGDSRTSRIPVIILTTLTTAGDMQLARASGCEALLVKPCLPEELRAEAARLIDVARHSARTHTHARTPKPA